MMNRTIISFILIGLLLSASFAPVVMNHADGHGSIKCPFEVTAIADCTQAESPLSFIFSHLNALAKFFSVVPGTAPVVMALALLLLFTLAWGSSRRDGPNFSQLFIKVRLASSFIRPQRFSFNHWFSLHENSPALLTGR